MVIQTCNLTDILNIARKSIKECVTCSSIARRQNFISNDVDEQSRIKLEELAKMISGLKRKLKE
ncbi:MAG: four helix bundle protein [Sediminicola sp.]|jgi:four helix bundle protein